MQWDEKDFIEVFFVDAGFLNKYFSTIHFLK